MCFYTWKITLYPKSENSKGICCPTPPYQSPSHPDPQEGRKCFSLAPSRRKSSRYGLVWASTRLVGFWRVFLHLVCKIKPSMRRKKNIQVPLLYTFPILSMFLVRMWGMWVCQGSSQNWVHQNPYAFSIAWAHPWEIPIDGQIEVQDSRVQDYEPLEFIIFPINLP